MAEPAASESTRLTIWRCSNPKCTWVQDVEGLCPRGHGPTPGHGRLVRVEVVPASEAEGHADGWRQEIEVSERLRAELERVSWERDEAREEAECAKRDAHRLRERLHEAKRVLRDVSEPLAGGKGRICSCAEPDECLGPAAPSGARCFLAEHGRGG